MNQNASFPLSSVLPPCLLAALLKQALLQWLIRSLFSGSFPDSALVNPHLRDFILAMQATCVVWIWGIGCFPHVCALLNVDSSSRHTCTWKVFSTGVGRGYRKCFNLDLKGEGDTARLAGEMREGSTFVGWCASKILQSDIPVEVQDGVPCNSKDTRDADELEIMIAPGNGQVEIRPLPPKGGRINS